MRLPSEATHPRHVVRSRRTHDKQRGPRKTLAFALWHKTFSSLPMRPAWESNPAVSFSACSTGLQSAGSPASSTGRNRCALVPSAETRRAAHPSRTAAAHLPRGRARTAARVRSERRMLLLQVALSTGRAQHFRVPAHQLLEFRSAIFTAIFVNRHSPQFPLINNTAILSRTARTSEAGPLKLFTRIENAYAFPVPGSMYPDSAATWLNDPVFA